jgi:hypothetical protein
MLLMGGCGGGLNRGWRARVTMVRRMLAIMSGSRIRTCMPLCPTGVGSVTDSDYTNNFKDSLGVTGLISGCED